MTTVTLQLPGGGTTYTLTAGTDDAYTLDVTYSLSKNPIVIPMPNAENYGFDIGFTESESITVNMTALDSASSGSLAMTLKNAIRKQTGVAAGSLNKPMTFVWGDNTFYVLPRGLTIKQESGQGDIVSFTLQLEVVKNA